MNTKVGWLFTTAIFIVVCISIAFRVRLSMHPDYYNPRDPIAYYWTENALQYHYADLIAHDEGIPSHDYKLQAPQGVAVFENLTIMMEFPCGWLYRILHMKEKGVLFHTWTIFYIALWSSLTLCAVYACARSLGFNHVYSLLAGILSVFSLVAVGRSTFGFLNEDFALPFLFLGLALHVHALRTAKNTILLSFVAGSLFAIALSSWHFSRFIFLSIVACSVLNLWLLTFDPEDRRKGAVVLLLTCAVPLVSGTFVPVLRSQGFFISPGIILGCGVSIAILLVPSNTRRPLFFTQRGLLTIGIGLLLLAISVILTRTLNTEETFRHVWSLFINKLKFFGIKPSQPGLIDYAARSLWIEAFNSPHPVTMFRDLFPVIVPAIAGFYLLLRNSARKLEIRFFLLLSALFFLLYLAVERMGIVFNPFMCTLSAGIGIVAAKRKKCVQWLVPLCMLLICGFNFYQGYNLHRETMYVRTLHTIFGREQISLIHNWRLNDVELVHYVTHRTPSGAIFLSRYGAGPLLLAYADRAIALQPKFEVRDCQARVKEYLDAIYDSEEQLYRLCQKWEVDYFLYDIKILLDNTDNSERWVADRMEVSKKSTAFMMHFSPESLQHFQLEYQNTFYRLYRVVDLSPAEGIKTFADQPIYDLRCYGEQHADRESFNDRGSEKIMLHVDRAKRLLQKASSLVAQNPHTAIDLMEKSIQEYPSLIGSATTMGIAYILTGRLSEGVTLCLAEVENNPFFPLGHYNLAYGLALQGRFDEARKELEETLQLDSDFSAARSLLEQLNVMDHE